MFEIGNIYRKNAEFVESAIEGECMRITQDFGINIDRDKLIRCITDAKSFYDDGYHDAMGEIRADRMIAKQGHEELIFTRKFIHDRGLEFELMSEWEKYKREKDS